MSSEANRGAVARVYLDAAAAAPLHPVADQAIRATTADGWADPTKLYLEGRRAAQLLDAARSAVADVVGCHYDEVVFCASGSDAARLAAAGLRAGRGRDLAIYTAVEHSAVIRACRAGPAEEIPVDRLGRVDLDAWAAATVAPGLAFAACQSVNHETGTAQPLAPAAAACAEAGVPLYVDAAASLGRMPAPGGWSVLSASAAKWGGPAGVGVLAVRRGTRWAKPWPADRVDPLTVSLPLVVGAAAALRAFAAAPDSARLSGLVDRVRATVPATVPDVEVVGDPTGRAPHIVTFSCLYVDGEALLTALDRHGFAVSSGSSCTAATLRPSHVLEAMGVLSHGNVRVSLHPGTTDEDVDRFLAVLPGIVADLRAEAGVTGL